MPFHIPPVSRRQFIAGSLAAGATALAGRFSFAAEPTLDPQFWALLSDPHLDEKRTQVDRNVNMAEQFEKVQKEILGLEKRPARLLINGDLAHTLGTPADYKTVLEMIEPYRAAGIHLHTTMGNHDDRKNFWQAIRSDPATAAVENRHVTTLSTDKAHWVMLDSLDVVNKTPGVLGKTQLEWLGKALDARADKPVIVTVHHNPTGKGSTSQTNGITDTKALWDVLTPRKQVKLLFFGHTHHWEVSTQDGIHCVNLPPTGYVFTAGDPNGWVRLDVAADSATIELRCNDTSHKAHGQKHELKWRV